MNDANADRTYGDGKAIPQEIPQCRIVSLPMHSSWLVMPFELRKILPSFLTAELVSCRAAGKRSQPELMWMVATRACAEREKRAP